MNIARKITEWQQAFSDSCVSTEEAEKSSKELEEILLVLGELQEKSDRCDWLDSQVSD